MCGHTPLVINLGRTGCDVAEKFERGRHRHAADVGKYTWLEPQYPKFL